MDKKLLWKFLLVIVVSFFLATLLIRRFVYFDQRTPILPIPNVYKSIKHGHIYGLLADKAINEKVILFCQSNTGNLSHNIQEVTDLKNLGFNVLIYDYSGFGRSAGVPSEQQLYSDASLMVTFLLQTYRASDIILYGKGLGASVATYAARRYGIPTLILVFPFVSTKTIISNTTLLKYLSWFFSDFDTSEYLTGYGGRSLMIDSQQDEYIPYDSTAKLRQLVSDHVLTTGADIPLDTIKNFINKKII